MTATMHATRRDCKTFSIDACAKINLTLEVLGRRADGYHDIRSLAVGIDLRDGIRISPTDAASVSITCDEASLCSPDNLASQAASLMASRFDIRPGLHVEVTKRIPIGAGLGGGSADAAATIQLCNELYDLGLGPDELAALGAEIGSDVPLFFHLPCAVVRGRGEIVEATDLRWSGWVLLVHVQEVVPTIDVYRHWQASDKDRLLDVDLTAVRTAETADELNALLTNHLEPAVFRVASKVGRIHADLQRRGHGPLRVSGAGSILYKLFDNQQAANEAAARVVQEGFGITTMVVAAPVVATTLKT